MLLEGGGDLANSSVDIRSITAVVLAGGRSRRLGRDKALELVGGVPLVSRVTSAIETISSETVIVVAEERQAQALPLPGDARIVQDLYPNSGSLGGILTGLIAATGVWTLVVACDMPFLNRALLSEMASNRDDCDAVVPLLNGRPEPTHALYSKVCIEPIRNKLEAGELKISAFFESVRVKYVPQRTVEMIDPGLWSFFNVNTPQDLVIAVARAAELAGDPVG